MKKLHFETTINAPAEKVWDVMLSDETYRQWTSSFSEEPSHFEGDWSEGSKMRFLGSDGSGMLSEVAENRPYEFMSIKHIGVVNKGVEDRDSEEAKKWAPAFENYTLSEENGITTVAVEQDVAEEYEDMFSKSWPKALEKLKELCEK